MAIISPYLTTGIVVGSLLVSTALWKLATVVRMNSVGRRIASSTGESPFSYLSVPIKVELCSSPMPSSFVHWDAPQQTVSQINELLRGVPDLISILKSGSLLQVSFPPEVTRHLYDGSYRLMHASNGSMKPVAMDAKRGIIVAQGNVKSAGRNPVAVADATWQVLAIITAQKFLSDIQSRLKEIQSNLNSIKRFIEAEEFSRLESARRYISEIYRALESGDCCQAEIHAVAVQLESIDAECAVILNRRLALLDESTAGEEGQLRTGWAAAVKRRGESVIRFIDNKAPKLGIGGDFKEFQAEMGEFEHASRVLCLAVAVRNLLLHLRTAMLMSGSRNLARCEELQNALQRYAEVQAQFFTKKADDVQKVVSKRTLSGSKTEAVTKMSGQLNDLKDKLHNARTELLSSVEHVATQTKLMSEFLEKGAQLVVDVGQDGRIQKVFRNHDCS
jgi:hypothetical protein